MRYSNLFGKTTREVSKDIVVESHRLLIQAGYIKQSVAGRYFMLPLGLKVRSKIQQIIREEMNKAGGQEIVSPVLQPLSLWEETNRDEAVNFELMQIEDRRGEKFALGGTAEEMVVDLVRKYPLSYRDLPFNLYQFSNKFRDEARAYGGLLRIREFLMKDAYSFDIDKKAFEISYKKMWEAYSEIFKRCGLNTYAVEASGGVMGDYKSREFQVEFADGEGKFFVSEDGEYTAHEDVAEFTRDERNKNDPLQEMTVISVQRGNSVEEGCRAHNNEAWQHIKNVIYKATLHDYSTFKEDKRIVFIHAVIRGDLKINEDKLQKILSATTLDIASDEEVKKLGYVAGFISPCKVMADIVIGDLSLNTVRNSVTGGDELNKDRINVNYGRDYSFKNLYDIATAFDGAIAPNGHGRLSFKRGTEVGQIFELEYKYTKAMNANFIDQNGSEQPYYMGCYGIGLERTLQMVAETHRDQKGLMWPTSIAPFDVHLISIGGEEIQKEAEDILYKLEKQGKDVLWDDRDNVSPGVKFADADLIGIPIRIVVSPKSLEKGGVEIKKRDEEDVQIVQVEKLLNKLI